LSLELESSRHKLWGVNKYLIIAKNMIDETVSFRLNFVMWRVRVILQILTLYFLWLSVLPKDTSFLGYNQSQILTYILGTSILSAFVLASRSQSVGDEINKGDLSNFLLKPINYFLYHFARDMGDKFLNLIFSLIELTILFFILKPPLFVQAEPPYLLLAVLAAVLALILYFFISFLLGLIGFWSPEVWAPRFIFFIVITFFAGGLFPLDILPKAIFNIFQFLPFSYLLYFPLKIYLGQLAYTEIFRGLAVSFVWIILMFLIVKSIWNFGLKLYTAQGR